MQFLAYTALHWIPAEIPTPAAEKREVASPLSEKTCNRGMVSWAVFVVLFVCRNYFPPIALTN